MDRDITYIEAQKSTDVELLVEYCKQGALDAEVNHGGTRSDWRDGRHLIESFLDHNSVADADTREAVAAELDRWLIVSDLLRDCPPEGRADHEAVANAIARGERLAEILKLPELNRWPESYRWVASKLGAIETH